MTKQWHNLFQKLDEFLFKQVDQIKSSQAYLKVTDQLGYLEENHRRFLNQIITYILMFIPIAIILTFYIINNSVKSHVETKTKIYGMAKSLIDGRKIMNAKSSQFISSTQITNKANLNSKISALLGSKGIDSSNVDIKNFNTDSTTSGINKTTATITFNKFTIKNLTDLLQSLVIREKMKIKSTEVRKQKTTETLSGSLDIILLSKGS